MRLGLVLLPEQSVSQRCIEYANDITKIGGRRSTLGPGALPHISLAHVDGASDPEEAWQQCINELPTTCMVNIGALSFIQYLTPHNTPPAPPGVIALLAITSTEQFRDIERHTLSLPWVTHGTVTNWTGDRSQPHITLGVIDAMPKAQIPLAKDLLGRDGVKTSLALGPIGPKGIFERVLFQAD